MVCGILFAALGTTLDQVVFAGEGEPTLRMDALLAVARRVKSFRENNLEPQKTDNKQSSPLAMRV